MGSTILGADTDNIQSGAARTRVIGNFGIASASAGINFGAGTGDNSVATGNIIKDQGGDSIGIGANDENCVAVGNRLDGAVADSSGTSTVADNNETAF